MLLIVIVEVCVACVLATNLNSFSSSFCSAELYRSRRVFWTIVISHSKFITKITRLVSIETDILISLVCIILY